jgi:hypothetical protein
VCDDGPAIHFTARSAVVSVAPGTTMLTTGGNATLREASVVDTFVLHGPSCVTKDARAALFRGLSVDPDPTLGGVVGYTKGASATVGQIAPRSLTGSVHVARAGAAVLATFETSRRVP